MHHVISCKATYTYGACVLSCDLLPNCDLWQNEREFLRATTETRGCNGYRNKSQHRKSTLEKKIIPLLLRGFEPTTFQSRVLRSSHLAIPAPNTSVPGGGEGRVSLILSLDLSHCLPSDSFTSRSGEAEDHGRGIWKSFLENHGDVQIH